MLRRPPETAANPYFTSQHYPRPSWLSRRSSLVTRTQRSAGPTGLDCALEPPCEEASQTERRRAGASIATRSPARDLSSAYASARDLLDAEWDPPEVEPHQQRRQGARAPRRVRRQGALGVGGGCASVRRTTPSGVAAKPEHKAAADERSASGEDEEHVAAREGQLSALTASGRPTGSLSTGSLKAGQIVLEHSPGI